MREEPRRSPRDQEGCPVGNEGCGWVLRSVGPLDSENEVVTPALPGVAVVQRPRLRPGPEPGGAAGLPAESRSGSPR